MNIAFEPAVQAGAIGVAFTVLFLCFSLLKYYFDTRDKGADKDQDEISDTRKKQAEFYTQMVVLQSRVLDIQEANGKMGLQASQIMAEELAEMRKMMIMIDKHNDTGREMWANRVLDEMKNIPNATRALFNDDLKAVMVAFTSAEQSIAKILTSLKGISKNDISSDEHDHKDSVHDDREHGSSGDASLG